MAKAGPNRCRYLMRRRAGWPAADNPRLAQTGEATLHLTWMRTELPGDGGAGFILCPV